MKTILITGASGAIGRPLVLALAQRRVRLRAVGRSIQSRDFPSKVDYVNTDLAEPERLVPELEKADTLFVHPRAVGASAADLMILAAKHGVRRIVALSTLDVEEDPALQPSRSLGDLNREVEQAVMGSGLPWVCVRASPYARPVVDLLASQARVGAVVGVPYPSFAEAPVHERDLTEVIARTLLDDKLEERVIEVTGPAAMTHQELAEVIAEVAGRRPLRFEEMSPATAVNQLVANGLSRAFAEGLMARCARELGRPATVTDEVHQLTGHPAHTFATWVADNAGQLHLLG
ncbi:uncharacterized protein YbjT (DUF2867 family) [Kribbella voronezhensis]|uniref:Uncharacterized protein YbjT (DUF2867 family) n=1 Tax=Kribbella voronezhensis TaxID=2512212 RepID=A0A4R7T9L0_9ACTN|nr:NAD(P)H-binding protein [Kribbella voronezhensis]TDU87918.1 uncharacterized protein YbjT (DUF2867 family) [Kribbella voronezhensis]